MTVYEANAFRNSLEEFVLPVDCAESYLEATINMYPKLFNRKMVRVLYSDIVDSGDITMASYFFTIK